MSKKKQTEAPQFSRIDFYRLQGDEFFDSMFRVLQDYIGEGSQANRRWSKLNAHQRGIHAWWSFRGDVENGGLAQYFYNHADGEIADLLKLFKATGNRETIPILQRATKVFQRNRAKFRVAQPFGANGLFATQTELTALDRPVSRSFSKIQKQIDHWVRGHMAAVFESSDGEAFDSKFTGEIVARHSNGAVFETATVRTGKLIGAYHRYFDDGTPEYSCFYDKGKISADYWPNGTVKHKKMKRGALVVYEWYFSDGRLQKQFVADKSGDAVEPIRLWHENGQLAEELHTRKGDELGPWLKFFDDGATKLVAQHHRTKGLIVTNAWDDKRKQVVKNGTGTFFNDGDSINTKYDLVSKSSWHRSEQMKGGVPHGEAVTWHDGVLWSRGEYSQGKDHGVHIIYYDNGRIRSRTLCRQGKVLKEEEFPKFDRPQPAVRIETQADARLYEAWQLPLHDTYPAPVNLHQEEAACEVPEFLHEVYQRNQSRPADFDDYDDWNTLDDSAVYFLAVSATGAVEQVQFSGCSAYSAGVVDTYPPILKNLKFRPGVLRGRKVPCRVVASVRHTFVEGKK